MQPTTNPTSRPTCHPTSSAPTSSPTHPTPRPTILGRVFAPSPEPTASPTSFLEDYKSSKYPTWKTFQRTGSVLYRESLNSSEINFSSYNFRGTQMNGTCADWTKLVSFSLTPPLDTMYFSQIRGTFESYDIEKKTTYTQIANCADKNAVAGIVKALTLGYPNTAEFMCNNDGNLWRAYTCNGNPLLCVNCKFTDCKAPSTTGVYCPGTGFTGYKVVPQVLNPCAPTCTLKTPQSVAWASLNFRLSFKKLYPEFSHLSVDNTTDRSVTISVNTTKPGDVYCAVFPFGIVPLQVSQIMLATDAPIHAGTEATGNFSKTFRGLLPDTQYDIYCYSDDNELHIMPIDSVTSTGKLYAKTSGTHAIRFTQAPFTIFSFDESTASSLPVTPFKFSVDALPPSPYSVSIYVEVAQIVCKSKLDTNLCDNGGPPTCASGYRVLTPQPFFSVAPQMVTLSYTSITKDTTLQLLSNQLGSCFRVNLYSRGNFKYLNATAYVSVRARLNPPALASAQMSPDGSKLLINFDSATNRASSMVPLGEAFFNCALLFNVSVPTGPFDCSWASDSQVVYSPAVVSAKHVKPGDPVRLKSSAKITAKCVIKGNDRCADVLKPLDQFARPATVYVSAPSLPTSPQVFLIVPKLVGSCEDVTADARSTTGGGGVLPWRSVVWSLTVQSASILTNRLIDTQANRDIALSLATQYAASQTMKLNTPGATCMSPLHCTIQHDNVNRIAGIYTVVLTVTNNFNITGMARTSFTVTTSTETPSVSIFSPSPFILQRSSALSLFAQASFPSCNKFLNFSSGNLLNYTWSIYDGILPLYQISSTSLDKRQFSLKPYTLEAGGLSLIHI